jgi:hypothetical protein
MNDETKSFQDMMRQVFGSPSEDKEEEIHADLSEEGFELADAEDVAILMHRDIHFGGSFDIMLEYYRREGKGIQEDISIPRAEELNRLELATGQDLAGMLLSGADAERVGRSRDVYKTLREICEFDSPESLHPRLIAALILSEDLDSEEELNAIVAEGPSIIPSLIQLASAKEFYDPLFPGYGLAPSLAIKALGMLKDPKAIPALFEASNSGDFDHEEAVIHALVEIGPKAKQFLIRVLTLRPMVHDNEQAARALTHFVPDEEVAKVALEQLQDPAACRHQNLAAYLVLCCEGLIDAADRERFVELDKRDDLHALHLDIQAIARSWKGL